MTVFYKPHKPCIMRIKRSIFIFALLLFSVKAFSQNSNIANPFSKTYENRLSINSCNGFELFSERNLKTRSSFWDDYSLISAVNFNADHFLSLELGVYTGGFFGPGDTKRARGIFGIGNEYSLEVYSNFKDKVIAGPRYTFFILLIALELGVTASVYSDFSDHANLSLRPFAGISILGALCFSYGYNFALSSHSFKEVNNNTFQIKYRF